MTQAEFHQDALEAFKQELQAEFVALYLVGSHGTEHETPESDIDYILATSESVTSRNLDLIRKVREDLRRRLHPRIDVRPVHVEELLEGGIGVKREGRFISGRVYKLEDLL